MIKLVESGVRGGTLTVTMSPFDLLSLQEGLTYAVIHLEDLMEKDTALHSTWKAKAKDARANYAELEAVLVERNEVLG